MHTAALYHVDKKSVRCGGYIEVLVPVAVGEIYTVDRGGREERLRWSIRFSFSAADRPAEISTYDINHTEGNPSLQSEEVCTKRHATNLTSF